jgi:hypothetical protein
MNVASPLLSAVTVGEGCGLGGKSRRGLDGSGRARGPGGTRLPTYTITRLIRSAIRFSESSTIDGIDFDPIVPFKSEQILVSASVREDHYRDASKLFDEHLLSVVDALSVVTGAALAPLGGSTLIEKSRSKYVYLHAVKRRQASHMTLIPQHRPSLLEQTTEAVARFSTNEKAANAAHYLRQAALTEHLLTGTFHTLQAAESIVGRQSRHSRLRTLLGDELYDYFYGYVPHLQGNRRNVLAHGGRIQEESVRDRTVALQELLLRQLRESLGGIGDIRFSPVRGFVSFDTYPLFLEPVTTPLNLPTLVDAAANGDLHSASDPRWVGVDVTRRLWRTW